MKTGFEDDHTPLKEIPRVVKAGHMPSTFPKGKYIHDFTRISRPLAVDAAMHFTVDPWIVRVSSYPVQLEYEGPDHNGEIRSGIWFPEFGILKQDGSRTYIDAISVNEEEEWEWIPFRTMALQRAAREQLEANYSVLNELSLHIEPRMTNLRTIFRHIGELDPSVLMTVRVALDGLPETTTIGEVRETAKLPLLQFAYFEDGRCVHMTPLAAVDLAFTAIMQLAAVGEVALDLSRPITDHTSVHLASIQRLRRAA